MQTDRRCAGVFAWRKYNVIHQGFVRLTHIAGVNACDVHERDTWACVWDMQHTIKGELRYSLFSADRRQI